MRLKDLVIGLCLLSLLAVTPLWADESAAQGRAVLAQHKDAVITISYVISMSYEGDDDEQEGEATATVIGADGLTVLSLSVLDPIPMYAKMGYPTDGMSMKMISLKMIMGDGKEIPAEIVLRDQDLDLAFIRPVQAPEKPMSFVDMKTPGAPQLLDYAVVLYQQGKVARRAHSASLVRIETIVKKPRTFYILSQAASRTVVCSPAFTVDGKCMGIGVMRYLGGGDDMDSVVIIVDANDIMSSAEQAVSAGEDKE